MTITYKPDDPDLPTMIIDDTPTNILGFPREFTGPPQTIEQLREEMIENKIAIAIDVSMDSIRALVLGIESMGWKISSHSKSGYELALLVELLKSMIMRQQGVRHPLHDNIQNIMKLEEQDLTPEMFVEELMYGNIIE